MPVKLAGLSKGLLRNKIPDLQLALEGRVTEHHRFMLQQLMDDLRHAKSKMGIVTPSRCDPD